MEDYGYYQKKARRQRSGAPLAVRIIDLVMLVLTVLCTLLLVAAYLAAYIDPAKH